MDRSTVLGTVDRASIAAIDPAVELEATPAFGPELVSAEELDVEPALGISEAPIAGTELDFWSIEGVVLSATFPEEGLSSGTFKITPSFKT